MRWKAEIKSYDFHVEAKTQFGAQVHIRILESTQESISNLLLGLEYLIGISYVDDTEAADYLEQAEYNTGNPNEDLKKESLIKQLLYNPKLQAAYPLPFDEGWDKCRLWGKLRVLGLGTALKILFSDDGQENLVQTEAVVVTIRISITHLTPEIRLRKL
ncbi:unnamed protein product [Trifolium pratense]|uniref:Uncharacterized protein n=1 Tax=Trifolium pratense TaxID=57577 RepID=A0ACB0K511_TRIPR|nr:unnamed protein product [Trifolium pratense]